jgi:hypothetical protein
MIDLNECWEYAGYKTNRGYGTYNHVYKKKRYSYFVHRLVYVAYKGEIPEGLFIDHLCRVRHCINPDHLEAVTTAENNRRALPFRKDQAFSNMKTHCPQGHEYSGDNLQIRNGFRYCVICQINHRRRYNDKKKAERFAKINAARSE